MIVRGRSQRTIRRPPETPGSVKPGQISRRNGRAPRGRSTGRRTFRQDPRRSALLEPALQVWREGACCRRFIEREVVRRQDVAPPIVRPPVRTSHRSARRHWSSKASAGRFQESSSAGFRIPMPRSSPWALVFLHVAEPPVRPTTTVTLTSAPLALRLQPDRSERVLCGRYRLLSVGQNARKLGRFQVRPG
jgi:hypothetical protein